MDSDQLAVQFERYRRGILDVRVSAKKSVQIRQRLADVLIDMVNAVKRLKVIIARRP
jgi:hypothetical protein